MLRDLAVLSVSTVVLATVMRSIDAWQKEVRLQRRLSSLQQLLLSIENARGNALDLDTVPKSVLDAISKRIPEYGAIVVLSAHDGLPADVPARIREAARHQPICVLIEGTDPEVSEFTGRNNLLDVSPIAVPAAVGGHLVDGMRVPFLIHVRHGLVLRRSSLAEPERAWRFDASGRGAESAVGDRDQMATIFETRR
jgi:hypothetical protein